MQLHWITGAQSFAGTAGRRALTTDRIGPESALRASESGDTITQWSRRTGRACRRVVSRSLRSMSGRSSSV